MHRPLRAPVSWLSALALVGCGGAAEPTVSPATPAASSPAVTATSPPPEPTTAAVPEVLAFTAATVDGGELDGAMLAGKPAVFWFWAPWCPICKQGASAVSAAAAELDGDVAFVGVAGLSGSVDDMQAFVDDTGSDSIPHIADVDGAVFTRFGVAQQDTFAFVGPDGTVELVDGYSSDPDLVGIARERFGL